MQKPTVKKLMEHEEFVSNGLIQKVNGKWSKKIRVKIK